jgi:hypothetical protein
MLLRLLPQAQFHQKEVTLKIQQLHQYPQELSHPVMAEHRLTFAKDVCHQKLKMMVVQYITRVNLKAVARIVKEFNPAQ